MSLGDMPILRIEIERMKERITHALVMHEQELGPLIAAHVDAAVASFPFEDTVKRVVHEALQDAVQNYFKYGDGQKSIQEALREAFK